MKPLIDFSNWRGDLSGGLTAGIVALPLALAFGVQSGLGAVTGIYCAVALGIFAGLFGGTVTQISGPTGPMTVVSTMVVIQAIDRAGNLQNALPVILATFMLAGAFQILLGLARLGSAVKFIPYPVISGFMTGIAIITILIQIFPAMGLTGPKKFLDIVLDLPHAVGNANPTAVWLTLITVSIVYLIPKITKKIPSSLFALLFVSIMANVLHLNVPVIGEIPNGLPELQWGSILGISQSDIPFILVPAITLALLGCIDSLLTSVIVDNISKTRHNSNRELIGQGIGNMVSSLIGGLPGAGTTMTSVVNTTTGSRTRLGAVFHGLFLFAVLIGIGHYAELIPLAVLAGILITIGFDIVDYKGLKDLFKIHWSEATVLVTVMMMTVFVDLIKAVAIGVVLATFIFVKRMTDLGEKDSSMYVSPLAKFAAKQSHKPFGVDFDYNPDIFDQVYIKHVNGPLFFGLTSELQKTMQSLNGAKALIFDFERVPFIDQSGVYALEEIVRDLTSRGILVMFVNMHSDPLRMVKKLHLVPNVVSEKNFFSNMNQCFEYLQHDFMTSLKPSKEAVI